MDQRAGVRGQVRLEALVRTLPLSIIGMASIVVWSDRRTKPAGLGQFPAG